MAVLTVRKLPVEICYNPSVNKSAIILTSILTLAMAAIAWIPSIPLGVPGEWEWQRHSGFQNIADILDRFFPALVGALPLLGISALGAKRITSVSRLALFVRYALLICVSWFWLNQVQKTTPVLHRTLKPYWVLYDKSSSGYFYEASFEIESVDDFLSTYESRMREGEVLHVGTHPPGLFLLSRFCINVCERSPTLTWLLNGFEDPEVRAAFRTVEAATELNRRLTNTELAGLHLLSSLTTLAAVLTLIPIAVIISQLSTRVTAWQAASLWTTLPCLAVFLPKSDLLFPLTSTTTLMFCILAMQGQCRILCSVLSGATLWFGLTLSLAHLPIVVLIAILMFIRAITSRLESVRQDAIVCGTIGTTIALLCLLWILKTDCNIVNVWILNLQNHEGFYGQYTRTWWKWLPVNLLELAFAVGPIVFVAAFFGFLSSARSSFRMAEISDGQSVRLDQLCLAAGLTFVLLWLSGKNQGEAARLWCFLTPWLLLCGTNEIEMSAANKRLGFQLLFAVFIVSGVSGFSF